MTARDAVTRCILTALALAATRLGAQTIRVASWASYEGVTDGDDWSSVGAQLALASARGDGAWALAELVSRFGDTDLAERIGGVLHPTRRWWITMEAGTATRPLFLPKNAWEVDVVVLVTRGASLGLGYRRWNYAAGAVNALMPHLNVERRTVSWDLRAFLSRNPSERTDAAFHLRATTALTPRTAMWILGAAGRESHLVATPPTPVVRSLETVTGAAGVRYNAGGGLTFRIDASVTRSRPVLSRRGVGVGIEKQL